MQLLPKEKLIKTGPVDHADWNYRSVLGRIQRLRFSLGVSLLPEWSQRLLEIGYGSGILMPVLKQKAGELYGIDVHDRNAEVQETLASEGVAAELSQAGAEELPYEDSFFDSVLAVSSLEFVSDLPQCCREIRRVLKPGGAFVVITPGHSALVDFGLRVLTGKSARKDFGDSREAIVPTLSKYFSLESKRLVPPFSAGLGTLYYALQLSKQK